MASSNIKLFDENKGNMLTDTEFNISTQRLNGLQTGVASSQLQNKAMYQVSLVAYAIAQVMMQNGLNANDTDAVSAFVANLSGAILQKVYDIASTAEAQAGVATGKWMSPALTKAFFDYCKANTSEAQNATDDTKWMSPALVRAAFNYIKATTAEAQAGTNDTKWMSPALVKTEVNKILTDNNFLQKSGGTMTGNLILNANPSANLGAATKQYVDATASNLQASIDSVRSDLTPAFGNLAKNGYYKFGDMSVYTANGGKYIDFRCYNLYTFLNNNFGNLSEIAVVIRNSTWTNNTSYTTVLCWNGDNAVPFASIGPNMTRTINIIRKFPVSHILYNNASQTYYYFLNGKGKYNNIASDNYSFAIAPDNTYATTTASAIGTAEVWYK